MVKVALLIGVSEYQPGFDPLNSAAKDIEAMQRVLQHPEIGGFSEVKALPNPTRQEMEVAVYSLFANREPEDLVLFYFSGHGVLDRNLNFYLVTPETRKDKRGVIPPTAVAASYLQGQMTNSRSEREVIILDCCYSGAIAKGLTVKGEVEVDVQAELGGKGRAILTSSSSTQYSFELEGSELSVYSRYLVEGIETGAADLDGDGLIDADELHQYTSEKVQEASPAMTPQFYPVEEGFKIYLARSPVDEPKLRYRKEAQKRAKKGKFTLVGRRILNRLRIDLELTDSEASAIEADVLRPYQEYRQKLQEYEQAFKEVVEQDYPLNYYTRNELKRFQDVLGLRDEDVAPIELQKQREQEEYENKLRDYEQEFSQAVEGEYPLSEDVRHFLHSLQQSNGLRNEDVAQIEQPILAQAEAKYQEKLKEEEAERQRQLELQKRKEDYELLKQLEDRRRYENDTQLQAEANRQTLRRIRIVSIVLSVALLGTGISTGWYYWQFQNALAQLKRVEYPRDKPNKASTQNAAKELSILADKLRKKDQFNASDEGLRKAELATLIEKSLGYLSLGDERLKNALDTLNRFNLSSPNNSKDQLDRRSLNQVKAFANLIAGQLNDDPQNYQTAYDALKESAFNPFDPNIQTNILTEQDVENIHRELIEFYEIDINSSDEIAISFRKHLYDGLEYLLKQHHLEDHLKKADYKTFEIMLYIAGRNKERRFDKESLENFSCSALQKIDNLWYNYPKRPYHFGFGIQKKIWERNGSPTYDSPITKWRKFYIDVGWKTKKSGTQSSEGYVNWSDLGAFHKIESAAKGNIPGVWGSGQWGKAWKSFGDLERQVVSMFFFSRNCL